MLCLYGNNLIGDSLLQTPAIRAWRQADPDTALHYVVGKSRGGERLFRDNPHLSFLTEAEFPPDGTPDSLPPAERAVSMLPMPAFQWGAAHGKTLAEGYGALVGAPVTDLRYDYQMTAAEEAAGREQVAAWEAAHGQPVVFVARHSASCSSNDPRCQFQPNKCYPNHLWVEVARWLLREGFLPVALGSAEEALDRRYHDWPGLTAYGLPIRHVAAMLKAAAATLCVDTGIRHLAAAVGGNMACMSGAIPLSLIRCVPVREGQGIAEEHRPIWGISTGSLIALARQVL